MKPTREQVLAEPAGWQVDAWVAEFVMDIDDPTKFWEFTLRHYSTDIAAAWEVVEKFRGIARVDITIFKDGGNHVSILSVDFPSVRDISADTAPLAICRAALLAVLDAE